MEKIIILDRDGIINHLLFKDNEYDSPKNISEIKIFEWIPEQLKILNDLGYDLAIATNQPSAAKGKTTYENLNIIHDNIISQIELSGAKILKSCICFHKKEDLCECRKPKYGLLQQAFIKNYSKEHSWMIGDRAVDIIAGHTFGLKTALLNYFPIELKSLNEKNISPTYIGVDLRDFVEHLI